MLRQLQTVLCRLLGEAEQPGVFHLFDPAGQLDGQAADEVYTAQNLNATFLIAVAGPQHPAAERANALLDRMADSAEWGAVAGFYRNGIERVGCEIEAECGRDPIMADRLRELAQWVSTADNLRKTDETQEKLWSVFFPEATGIRSDRQLHVERLRRKRRVDVAELNSNPIRDPVRQVLFTSNVLLTVPAASGRLADRRRPGPSSPLDKRQQQCRCRL